MIYWVGNGIANSNAAEVSFRTDSDLSALEALVRNPDDYVTGWTVLAVSFFLSAVSAVLGALAIRAVSARQRERIEAMSGGAF